MCEAVRGCALRFLAQVLPGELRVEEKNVVKREKPSRAVVMSSFLIHLCIIRSSSNVESHCLTRSHMKANTV